MIRTIVLLLVISQLNCLPSSKSYPSSLDWREKGAVLPVAERSGCDVNSAIVNGLDAISAKVFLKSGKLVRLSRQQIYDCSADWCPGQDFYANITNIYDLIDSKGVEVKLQAESYYPCNNRCSHTCAEESQSEYSLSAYEATYDNEDAEDVLIDWLQSGPLSVEAHIDCPEFQTYASGVFDTEDCRGGADHTFLLVGYGTDNGQDYWIARNNWGTGWGEQGYISVLRGKNILSIGNGFTKVIA